MLFLDHISTNREPSPEGFESFNFEPDAEITIKWLHSTRAHQQPLTCLVVEAGIIVTGSQVHFYDFSEQCNLKSFLYFILHN